MKKTTISCDCGCGKEEVVGETQAHAWFHLSLSDAELIRKSVEPKLSRKMHFWSLGCLNHWLTKALLALPTLAKDRRALDPGRRLLSVPGVLGLYI